MKSLWPIKLDTQHLELGVSVDAAVSVFQSTGGAIVSESDGEEKKYRVNLASYEMAFYYKDNKVCAVWYNDPAGRLTELGRQRKLNLYMQRFRRSGSWEMRLDNGWMRFFYNDVDAVSVVYGIHKDVVRVNAL